MAEAATNPQLQALRDRIDAIDRELLGALNRRATLAQQVGDLKKHEGSVVFRPEREAQVIDGLKAANAGPLAGDSIAPIWREIMSACRALETPTRVAYLGPAGTFSEEAALGYFGSSIVRVPCVNFDEVVRATSAGAADFGVVPVENNTEGVVARSLDLFLTMPLVHHRRDQPDRAPQPAAQGEFAPGHRGGAGAPAGARAMPRLAEPEPARRRAAPGDQQRRGRAPGRAQPGAGGHRQHARGRRIRPARGRRRRSRTRPTTARASRSSRTPSATRRPSRRATTARAWSCRWPTSPARCTTCWCR